MSGLRNERVLASKQFADGRFRNGNRGAIPGIKGNPLPTLGEFFFGGKERVPAAPLPVDRPLAAWQTPVETGLRATWLGHSTVLLESDGVRILTDPVFGLRASPVSFAGPKRFHPVPATIAELPPIDLVVLSHDHYDHLCAASLKELGRRGVPFVTALGVGARLEKLGVPSAHITELDWHETARCAGGRATITATPSQHFSGRTVGDRNTTLWASWVIETANHRVFFSGDTGLFPGFADIGKQYGPFDLVMLEVGAFHPSWGDIHLGPDNALVAHEMLGSGLLLPVHWGTFNLAIHAWYEPAETLFRAAEKKGAPLVLPRLGRPLEPARAKDEGATPWWRSIDGVAESIARNAGASFPPIDPEGQSLLASTD